MGGLFMFGGMVFIALAINGGLSEIAKAIEKSKE